MFVQNHSRNVQLIFDRFDPITALDGMDSTGQPEQPVSTSAILTEQSLAVHAEEKKSEDSSDSSDSSTTATTIDNNDDIRLHSILFDVSLHIPCPSKLYIVP